MRWLALIYVMALGDCSPATADRDPMMEGRAHSRLAFVAGELFDENVSQATTCVMNNATSREVERIAKTDGLDALKGIVDRIFVRAGTQDCMRAAE